MSRTIPALLVAVAAALVAAAPAQASNPGSNGRIAYWNGSVDPSKAGIYTVRPDGTERHRLTTSRDGYPVWGPDGRRIAFVRDLQIWLMGARGRHQHQVTSSTSFNTEPTFSADGETLAFVSNRTGTWNIFELASHRPYGHAHQISFATAPEGWAQYPAFAPDGSLYWIERSDTGSGPTFIIMHLPLNGTQPTAVFDCFACWGLDIAPSGQSLLWSISSEPNGVECGQLGLYDFATAFEETFPDCVDGQGLTDASFSPDGTRLVAHWFGATGRFLVTTDLTGHHRHRLPGTRDAANPNWQPLP